jgi:hypothetical protein
MIRNCSISPFFNFRQGERSFCAVIAETPGRICFAQSSLSVSLSSNSSESLSSSS